MQDYFGSPAYPIKLYLIVTKNKIYQINGNFSISKTG